MCPLGPSNPMQSSCQDVPNAQFHSKEPHGPPSSPTNQLVLALLFIPLFGSHLPPPDLQPQPPASACLAARRSASAA